MVIYGNYGHMDIWTYGYRATHMDIWIYGYMVTYDIMDIWI